MTREQKVDITLEELDREITIATYQEKQVRKCLAAAFARIENETAAGGDEMPLPSNTINNDENTVENGFRSMDRVLRLLERLSQKQLDCIYSTILGMLGTSLS